MALLPRRCQARQRLARGKRFDQSSDVDALGGNFEEERCRALGFHAGNQSAPLRYGYRLRAALGVLMTPTAVLPPSSP